MKRYIVTGGAGFIGSNFINYLLDRHADDVEIAVVDSLTYAGNLMTIASLIERPNVSFIKADIGDREAMSALFSSFTPDYVVNFAAESHVDRSLTNPRLFLETNVLGTQNLLDRAREAWAVGNGPDGRPAYRQGVRFLQISTDEVYGSLEKTYDQPRPLTLDDNLAGVVKGRSGIKTFGDSFFVESTPLSPRSPYSASKAAADMLVMAYHETYGLPVNITRCSNNYGPRQFPEKLIPLMINNILEGRPLPVYGCGANVRDWLYVDDHCKAIDLVLRRGRDGQIYNIGGFNEEANIEIVREIIALTRQLLESNSDYRRGASISVDKIDESLITLVADRPGHDMRYAIDPSKIATELGWYPETPFAEGIRETVEWYLSNRHWVDSVASGEYREFYEANYADR